MASSSSSSEPLIGKSGLHKIVINHPRISADVLMTNPEDAHTLWKQRKREEKRLSERRAFLQSQMRRLSQPWISTNTVFHCKGGLDQQHFNFLYSVLASTPKIIVSIKPIIRGGDSIIRKKTNVFLQLWYGFKKCIVFCLTASKTASKNPRVCFQGLVFGFGL